MTTTTMSKLLVSRHFIQAFQKSYFSQSASCLNAKRPSLSYISVKADLPLYSETIGQRLDYAADVYSDRESYVFKDSGKRLTFKSLKEKAERLATGLVALGLRPGDRVGLWAPSCYEWILTHYATAIAGIIQVNINPAYKSHELEFSLNKVGCKAIFMSETFKSQDFVKIMREVCPELNDATKLGLTAELNSKNVPTLKNVVVFSDKDHNGCIRFGNLLESDYDSSESKKLEEIKRKLQTFDPINIQYTSGSTGTPKGVVLSHHMMLNNVYQYAQDQNFHLKPQKICVCVPLFHCYGMVMGSMATITHGATCVIPSPAFNALESLRALHEEKCTAIYGTPTMYIDMLNQPTFSNYDTTSLEWGVVGGTTSPSEVSMDIINKLHAKKLIVAYGMTECSPLITYNVVEDKLEKRISTIGKLSQHLEAKVVDSEGKLVPVGEPGELLVRGYNTMIGYWEEKAKTDETFTADRFLKTGDIVRVDEEGYFHHLGRLKDMVIRGGENIYPKEIEDFLHEHPKIADVHVIGLPDKRMGEELCACIRLVNDSKMEEKELKTYCKERIAHFKVPRYVVFMNEFPMTVTGKVQKNKLREQMIAKFGLSK